MRSLVISALVCGLLAVPVGILSVQPVIAAEQTVKFSTAETPLGDILDHPEARAIIDKHIPGFTENEQVEMARGMSLVDIQMYAPDDITDEILAAIDADFSKIK